MPDQADKVVPVNIGVIPDPGNSGAMLFQSEDFACLTFNAIRPKPDGQFEDAGRAVIDLIGCGAVKFGAPGEDALPGHPLYANGLKGHASGVFEVQSSTWVRQMHARRRVSFPDDPEGRARHFIFTFHDGTLECVAVELRLKLSRESFEQIAAQLQKRVARRIH